MVREAHGGAVLRGDHPLPEASTTVAISGDRAGSSGRVADIVPVGGRHVALHYVPLPWDQRQGWDEE